MSQSSQIEFFFEIKIEELLVKILINFLGENLFDLSENDMGLVLFDFKRFYSSNNDWISISEISFGVFEHIKLYFFDYL